MDNLKIIKNVQEIVNLLEQNDELTTEEKIVICESASAFLRSIFVTETSLKMLENNVRQAMTTTLNQGTKFDA